MASASTTGALSSADWNTFDDKIEGTIAGGQVAFGIGNGVIYGDDSFVWDNNSKRLGLGLISPVSSLDIRALSTDPLWINLQNELGLVARLGDTGANK